MYKKNLHIHFVGIGGVGMSGIAEILVNLGYEVSGSDLRASAYTDNLEKLGVKVAFGHCKENITPNTDVLVYTSATNFENPEIKAAQSLKIPVIPRAMMLAEITRMKYAIIVSGSHGKTSTTSMIGQILSEVNLDPSVVVGGRIQGNKSGAKLGKGDFFVVESDESDASFLMLAPAIAIVTNIDKEHLSFYKSMSSLEQAFEKFIASVPFFGAVVACFDDELVKKMVQGQEKKVISYGFSSGVDFTAKNIVHSANKSSYELYFKERFIKNVTIQVPGRHMILNSLAALAVAWELDIELEQAVLGLEKYKGVARRTEVVGNRGGIMVIDDYGHHPTEITSTIRAVKEGWIEFQKKNINKESKLYIVFQPHRYSRTKELFEEFTKSFKLADRLIITDIYAASEKEIVGVTAEVLAQKIDNPFVHYIANLEDVPKYLTSQLSPGDVVMTMGAGSIGTLGKKILDELPS